jgi:hypothetical protein
MAEKRLVTEEIMSDEIGKQKFLLVNVVLPMAQGVGGTTQDVGKAAETHGWYRCVSIAANAVH